MRIATIMLAAVIGLSACQRSPAIVGDIVSFEECLELSYLCIRIKNGSDFDFDRIFVAFPDGELKYGSIRSGETSSYRRIDRAYRYAYTEAVSGEYRFVLQPFDFVGESYIRPGAYTYKYTTRIMDEPIVGTYKTTHGFMQVTLELDTGGT